MFHGEPEEGDSQTDAINHKTRTNATNSVVCWSPARPLEDWDVVAYAVSPPKNATPQQKLKTYIVSAWLLQIHPA